MLVQAKESKYNNPCARDGCNIKTEVGKPYVWDTEANKAYCSKECAEMATNQKVVDNSGNGKSKGTWTSKQTPTELWRKPEEAMNAIKIWHETVVPMILETTKKLSPTSTTKNGPIDKKLFEQVSQLYEEIFLGKMQGGSKS